MFSNILISTLPFLIPITIISLDHGFRHNGKFLDFNDFKQSVLTCLKSHEGWIFMILLFAFGFYVGVLV